MNNIKKILLLLISCLGYDVCNAFSKIYVFHINGVNTTYEQTTLNAFTLQDTLKIQSNLLVNHGKFDILYNKEDATTFCSVCHQLIDVLKQKSSEDYTLDDFVLAWMRSHPNESYPIGSPEYNELKKNIKSKYYNDPNFMGQNLADIKNQFHDKAKLKDEFKYFTQYIGLKNDPYDSHKPLVMLLPHSQGNLYANKLYDYLTQYESFPFIQVQSSGIATPANKTIMTAMPYLTSSNDKVINALRFFTFPEYTVLPANIEIQTPITSLGHGLIDPYLQESSSIKQIRLNTVMQILQLFGIGISPMFEPNGNYQIQYDIFNFSKLRQAKPMFIDPSGINLVCTNSDECERLHLPAWFTNRPF